MDDLVIVIKPAPLRLGVGGLKYEARLNGELLCTAREPFGTAARLLQARGVASDVPLAMRHYTADKPFLSTTVGKAAQITPDTIP